jgi:hypothetical protein
MKTRDSRCCSRIVAFACILLAVVLAAGCAPKVVPAEGPQVSGMMLTNFTASAYDTVPFAWNVQQNTLQSTGTSVLHANNTNGEAVLLWRSGLPLLAVQRCELMTATSKDLSLLVPPVGMESASRARARWYVQTENAFVAFGGQQGTDITITQQGLATGSKAQTLTVPVPSGLQPDVLYGSGSIANGFVLFEAPQDKAPFVKPFSLWLLRIVDGTTTWVRCGDASVFGGGFYSGEGPSFAHAGPFLYITRGHTKIGCINTAAASPSLTVPETLNTLLAKLYSEEPMNAEGPLQAQLASDGDTLIIGYPDVFWNSVYYAVDASGTVLGSLRADKASIVSFDAKGQQGFTLKTPGSPGYVSFPSIDLFESPVS